MAGCISNLTFKKLFHNNIGSRTKLDLEYPPYRPPTGQHAPAPPCLTTLKPPRCRREPYRLVSWPYRLVSWPEPASPVALACLLRAPRGVLKLGMREDEGLQ